MASYLKFANGTSWEASNASFQAVLTKWQERFAGVSEELDAALDFGLHANCKYAGLGSVEANLFPRLLSECESIRGNIDEITSDWSDEGKSWLKQDLESLISLLRNQV